jgi:hypothetical protein
MAPVERVPEYKQRYSTEELIYLRRTILRACRALPIGAKRNDKRQIAASLRSLFRNEDWLNEHTI